MAMRYRAQHWKDVPGVKYPEPPPEPQPPEGWVSTREAVARLGMVYHNTSTTKLHQKGIRAQRWRGANGYWQLVWCAEDVANAQNARKYPEPPPEPQPPEGWLTGREAAVVLGWVFRANKISTRLHKLGVRCEQWKPSGRHRQLVWCAEDVANAQNARKNAPQAKVASVPARTGKHGGRQAANRGKKQMQGQRTMNKGQMEISRAERGEFSQFVNRHS